MTFWLKPQIIFIGVTQHKLSLLMIEHSLLNTYFLINGCTINCTNTQLDILIYICIHKTIVSSGWWICPFLRIFSMPIYDPSHRLSSPLLHTQALQHSYFTLIIIHYDDACIHYSLLLNIYTIIGLSIHLLINIWAVFSIWSVHNKSGYKHSCTRLCVKIFFYFSWVNI